MTVFVCVVENCFFNHHIYKKGDTVHVEDKDLIQRMNGRFVSKEEFDKTVVSVVRNLDSKKDVYTKEEVKEKVSELATENAFLKNKIREVEKKQAPKKVG